MTTPNKLALMGSIQRETRDLLEAHGLKGWKVLFERSLHRAGSCRYARKEIVYSVYFMETSSPEERRNTITHEVAHAIAGSHAGHGERWAKIHKELGGTASVKGLMPQALATHEYFLWVGTCVNCGYRTGLEEEPDGVFACRACDTEKPMIERVFHWTMDGEAVKTENLGKLYQEQFATIQKGALA